MTNVENIIKPQNATLLYPRSQIQKHCIIVEMLKVALRQKNGYYLFNYNSINLILLDNWVLYKADVVSHPLHTCAKRMKGTSGNDSAID